MLLAVDGSRGSDEAGRIAAGIAKVIGSELHLIHVAPEPLVLPYDVPQEEELPPILQLARKNARTFVDEQAQRLEGMGAKVAGTHPVLGRPDVEIVAVAEEIGADLVVVGSRGLGGLRRALMGSVSDSVVRHAHCSVLVVRIPRARS
ncbi:MAG: universal stress protein [Rubrobacteraceae bacterium]|nr:universal stress protein [Rubrobacteraceae bacterium]